MSSCLRNVMLICLDTNPPYTKQNMFMKISGTFLSQGKVQSDDVVPVLAAGKLWHDADDDRSTGQPADPVPGHPYDHHNHRRHHHHHHRRH